MYIEHIKSNLQSVMTHTSQGFIMAGKSLTGKNMAVLGQNSHFSPAIIIPSKVVRFNGNLSFKFLSICECTRLSSGSFAVVRDDSDGLYRRGLVTQATGRSFGVSLNGETVVQVSQGSF